MDSPSLVPPAAELFFEHRDPVDVRLGSVTCRTPAPEGTWSAEGPVAVSLRWALEESAAAAAYAAARFAVVGFPSDEGVRRNGGRVGAAAAPTEIRRALYKLAVGPLAGLRIFDVGDTLTTGTLEESHERQRMIVERLLRDGKTVISIGGGNDVSYPDASAAAAALGTVLALNVDAHLDVRAEEPRNSGTPYRQLLVEGALDPSRFVEFGYQPFATASAHLQYLWEAGATALSLDEVLSEGVRAALKRVLSREADAVFWGVDMDSVSSAHAPGVSAPNPAGLSARQLMEVASLAGSDGRSRVFEVSEVNPRFDVDGRTSRLAAAAVHAFMAGGYA